jgi:phosphatidylglycerol---prolipoprotein diacylglyceryl transferase
MPVLTLVRSMSPIAIHGAFDLLAWCAAGLTLLVLKRHPALALPVPNNKKLSYYAALVFGSALGAYLFGTLNLWASGISGLGRSIEGAIFGGIVSVEIYKRREGITARTGARLAAPLVIGIAVGRIGCFLSGLDDFTYGTPTTLPWGHDFGDGIPRHPVQLYESAAMLAFLVFYLVSLMRRSRFVTQNGFYLAVLWYALQRFVWEFIKPYGTIAGPFDLFHFLSLGLVAYAVFMIVTDLELRHERPVST